MSTQLSAEDLYCTSPDRLLFAPEYEVWYAFYDSRLSVLTNVSGELDLYTYETKSEYRDVRHYISTEYHVKAIRIKSYDEYS